MKLFAARPRFLYFATSSLVVCSISISAFAATQSYLMTTQVYVDGALISSPKIISNSGETAKITQVSENPHRELSVKVVATEAPSSSANAILMKFDVSYVANGKTVKASPQIIARAGEPASIEVGPVAGKPEMKLTVTATRQ